MKVLVHIVCVLFFFFDGCHSNGPPYYPFPFTPQPYIRAIPFFPQPQPYHTHPPGELCQHGQEQQGNQNNYPNYGFYPGNEYEKPTTIPTYFYPDYSYEYENQPHGQPTGDVNDNDVDNLIPLTGKPMAETTTTTTTTTTTATPTTTSTTQSTPTKEPEFEIDLRFKPNKTKRSIEEFEPAGRQYENYRHHPHHFGYWDYPRFEEDTGPSHRLATCVQKLFECVPQTQCKNKKWSNNGRYCKWSNGEPYVCCEKSRDTSKYANYDMKCGRRKNSGYSAAIIGGVSVGDGRSYPWMVAVGEVKENEKVDWFCGGALINDKTVITAAHCFNRRSGDIVRLGERDFKNEEETDIQDIPVWERITHPSYRNPVLYNDIALLILAKPAKFDTYVRPVCLPDRAIAEASSLAFLTGWGQQIFGGDKTDKLQEVTVQIFNNTQCDKYYSVAQTTKRNYPRGILDSQMCAGDANGGKDACQGDSGSPLVMDDNGSFVLVGIVSAGIGCGSKTFPGIYTRVSSFVPWIYENIV